MLNELPDAAPAIMLASDPPLLTLVGPALLIEANALTRLLTSCTDPSDNTPAPLFVRSAVTAWLITEEIVEFETFCDIALAAPSALLVPNAPATCCSALPSAPAAADATPPGDVIDASWFSVIIAFNDFGIGPDVLFES